MESQSQQHGVYVHYNHTDACKDARWTAKESYQFMHSREWKRVTEFYSGLVNGQFSLTDIIGNDKHFCTEISMKDYGDVVEAGKETKSASVPTKDRTGRWSRVTFKIVLSYHGGSFDGWQKQPGLNTVQGLVEKSLAGFVDKKKVQLLKEKSLPVEGHAVVAGRTDKGVTAFQQVCSFYTWRGDVKGREIMEAINNMAPHKLKVRYVAKVPREFHPNFSAKWRHYLYIFPLHNPDKNERGQSNCETSLCGHNGQITREREDYLEEDDEFVADSDELDSRKKPRSFSVSRVNGLLQQLEGKSLSYRIFARDTKASRSIGPPTECLLYHARAVEARLPYSKEANEDGSLKVMCVELVANRFLRKMVRVLVATAIREAAAGSDCDTLLRLMDATCRRATAPPAPPDGLCLVDVGYQEFQQEQCLIL